MITDDPYVLDYKGKRLYADLAAEKPIAAEKEGQKIAVEIKVFGTPSPMTELERALGQYQIYKTFMASIDPARELFLAISADIYQSFFREPAVRDIVEV